MYRCGFWTDQREHLYVHALGLSVELGQLCSVMQAGISSGCVSLTAQEPLCLWDVLALCCLSALPGSRRDWCGLSKSLCCCCWEELGSDHLTLLSTVILTQLIGDISWQSKFAHTAARGPAVLICVPLCRPKALSCNLRCVSCLAVKDWDWNYGSPQRKGNIIHSFGWQRKLCGSQVPQLDPAFVLYLHSSHQDL